MSSIKATRNPPSGRRGFETGKLAIAAVAMMSSLVNILYLTGSFFMLEVYDRVLPSRSVPTLVGLCSSLAVRCSRSRACSTSCALAHPGPHRALRSTRADQRGSMSSCWPAPLRAGRQGDGLQPLRDLDQIRAFLAGAGPLALFDLPWMPLYLADLLRLPSADRRRGAGRRRSC